MKAMVDVKLLMQVHDELVFEVKEESEFVTKLKVIIQTIDGVGSTR